MRGFENLKMWEFENLEMTFSNSHIFTFPNPFIGQKLLTRTANKIELPRNAIDGFCPYFCDGYDCPGLLVSLIEARSRQKSR